MMRRGGPGVRAAAPAVAVHLLTTEPDSAVSRYLEVKVGLVVPKAVGNAVTRNRVKRRLRAAVTTRLSLLPAGSEMVVRAFPEAARVPFSVLEEQLGRAVSTALSRVQAKQ